LTVDNALITTATVQIRVLTLNGKRVTLSVFRQIIEEQILAHDGSLRGSPYGWVNYHGAWCAEKPEHWHVIWRPNETELRVALVEKRYPDRPAYLLDEAVDRYALAAFRDHWTRGGAGLPVHHRRVFDDRVSMGTRAGVALYASLSAEAEELLRIERALRSLGDSEGSVHPGNYIDDPTLRGMVSASAVKRALRHLGDEAAASLGSHSTDVALHAVDELVDAAIVRHARQNAVRKALGDLPQLFIAV
jgi:hypothetical protein